MILPVCYACGESLWDHALAPSDTVLAAPVKKDGKVVGHRLYHPLCWREQQQKEQK